MRRIIDMHSISVINDPIPQPIVIDVEEITENNFQREKTIWNGEYQQIKVMSIMRNEEINSNVNFERDRFIRIESGRALVTFGKSENEITLERAVDDENAIIIPAGTWYSIKNIGNSSLKLMIIQSPSIEVLN